MLQEITPLLNDDREEEHNKCLQCLLAHNKWMSDPINKMRYVGVMLSFGIIMSVIWGLKYSFELMKEDNKHVVRDSIYVGLNALNILISFAYITSYIYRINQLDPTPVQILNNKEIVESDIEDQNTNFQDREQERDKSPEVYWRNS